MDPRACWSLRYVRALVLSTGALGLAVLAHISAGGLLPDIWAFGAMLALCTLVSGLRLGTEASRLEIVALLVAGQTVMHGAMTALAGHADDPEPPPTNLGHAIEHAIEHLAEDLTWAHAPMMCAHLAAAALVGLWIAYGERALWSLLRLMTEVARTFIGVLVVHSTPIVVNKKHHFNRFDFTVGVRTVLLSATHVRRGPPAVLRAS